MFLIPPNFSRICFKSDCPCQSNKLEGFTASGAPKSSGVKQKCYCIISNLTPVLTPDFGISLLLALLSVSATTTTVASSLCDILFNQ